MLLTMGHMAKLLGATRVTYASWVKGGPIRAANNNKVRLRLKKMFSVMKDTDWPQPSHIAMTNTQRFNTLRDLMQEDPPPDPTEDPPLDPSTATE
jgi:hypothetical protein